MNDFLKTGTLSQEAEAIVRSAFEKAIDEFRNLNHYTHSEFKEYFEKGRFYLKLIAGGVYKHLKNDVSRKMLSVQLTQKTAKKYYASAMLFSMCWMFCAKMVSSWANIFAKLEKQLTECRPPLDEFVAADYDEMRSRIDHDIFDAPLGLMKPVGYSLWYDIQSDNASLKLWLKKDGELKITGEHESISWLCLNSIRINHFRELQSTNTSAANLVRDIVFDHVITKYYNDHREDIIRDYCAQRKKRTRN